MPHLNRIILKSGQTLEFEDQYGNVRQKYYQYLQNPSANSSFCNLSGQAGQELALDLREVVAVLTRPK